MNNSNLTVREYAHDTNDDRKAMILRLSVLSIPLKEGIGDYALKFIYEPHDEERTHIKLGAFIGENIVGTLNLAPQGNGSLLLRQFAVDAKLQGKGIGIQLIKYAHALALERGYSRIELHSRMNAVGFYKKAGYTSTGKIFNYPSITLEEMIIEL